MCDSFPDLISLADCGSDWSVYEDELYRIYMEDVVRAGHRFRGRRVSCQFRPEVNGKGFAFWHLITEGDAEEERMPDLRRCERIRFVGWILRNAETDDRIRWWRNRRGKRVHVVLWLWEQDFAVVLAERENYYLLKTAYVVASNRARSFEREWRAYYAKPW